MDRGARQNEGKEEVMKGDYPQSVYISATCSMRDLDSMQLGYRMNDTAFVPEILVMQE